MYFDDEQETKEERKVSKARKNKSLSRKIAEAVIVELGAEDGYDEIDNSHYITPEFEKYLAKIIKRVIRKHDAGK